MAENWLTLKLLPPGWRGRETTPRLPLLISVPKKIINLATHRNRIKRLIREAVRRDDFFTKGRGCFHFRVIGRPGVLGLTQVQRTIEQLKKEFNPT